MNMLKRLTRKETKLAVVGLGYVGLPLAAAFAGEFHVIGFDRNEEKVQTYRQGHDITDELGDDALQGAGIDFTTDPERLREASFIVIAVPTPINGDKTPDLSPVRGATETVARHLGKGSIVVYESTVYPGVTEDICRPLLEEGSGLVCGRDFKIGYSPERINPGDRLHRLHTITKIVSGMDEDSLADIADVYGAIIQKIYRAPDIRVAEAAKLAENTQRDINIAFMNELAMAFHQMGIDTDEVAKAMDTKWNAMGFRPGLVGGHCIGVDPYYFLYEAENRGQHSHLVSAGRRINNYMGKFVAQEIVKIMLRSGLDPIHSKLFLLGMTFKENCPDTRNSRSVDVCQQLMDYGLQPLLSDPLADPEEFRREYHLDLLPEEAIKDVDCLVILVSHAHYRQWSLEDLRKFYRQQEGTPHILIDVKHQYSRPAAEAAGFIYWAL